MATVAEPRRDEPAQRPNIASADDPLPGGSRLRAGRPRDHRHAATRRSAGSRRSASRSSACSSASARGPTRSTRASAPPAINPPVMWGVYIITFVFWVGIGHAGTLISAILYLFRAGFRTTIYRCAEAMTVFAVMTAGLFPILHLGRPWKFFWLIPYPNWRLIWPNPKSPLVWDVFAILTYLTVSSDVPLRRTHSRHRGAARPRDESGPQADLRRALARLAQLGSRVAALHARVPLPRRVRHAARALGALGRVVRLRDGAHAGLARDDLPAVLRRRRDLLRHRDGLHDHHPDPEVLQARALRHDQRSRRGGEALPLHVDASSASRT